MSVGLVGSRVSAAFVARAATLGQVLGNCHSAFHTAHTHSHTCASGRALGQLGVGSVRAPLSRHASEFKLHGAGQAADPATTSGADHHLCACCRCAGPQPFHSATVLPMHNHRQPGSGNAADVLLQGLRWLHQRCVADGRQMQSSRSSTLKQQVVLQKQLNLVCRAVLVAPGACEHSCC